MTPTAATPVRSASRADARSRYASNAVTTASPARLLLMLFERLQRDLTTAEAALADRNYGVANDQLQHAQQIVLELRTSLDVAAWSGGPGLEALYTFLHTELVTANLEKDASRVRSCRGIVDPLAAAWQDAALSLAR